MTDNTIQRGRTQSMGGDDQPQANRPTGQDGHAEGGGSPAPTSGPETRALVKAYANLNPYARADDGADPQDILEAGPAILSGRAGALAKRHVSRRVRHPAVRGKALRFLDGFARIQGGERRSKSGHRWRKYGSPWLSTALVVAGLALSFSVVGAPAGAILLWSGVALGALGRLQAMADLTLQYAEDKAMAQHPSKLRFAGWMAANALGLALVAVPVAGHFAAFPGTVGQLLATGSSGVGAGLPAMAAAHGGGLAANVGSGVVGLATRSNPEGSQGDKFTTRAFAPVEGDVVFPTLSNTSVHARGADAFVRQFGPAARALALAGHNIESGDELTEVWQRNIAAMRDDGMFNIVFCGLMGELLRIKEPENVEPPHNVYSGQDGESPALHDLKLRLWNETADVTGNATHEARVTTYRNRLRELCANLETVDKAARNDPRYGSRYTVGFGLAATHCRVLEHQNMFNVNESGNNIRWADSRRADGHFVDRDGNRTALVLDISNPHAPVLYHAITSRDEPPARTDLQEQMALVNLHSSVGQMHDALDLANRGLADGVGMAQRGTERILNEPVLVMTGMGPCASRAAHAALHSEVRAVLIDPDEDVLRTNPRWMLQERRIERWNRNVIAIGTEGARRFRTPRPDRGAPTLYELTRAPAHLVPPQTGPQERPLDSQTCRTLADGYYFEKLEDGAVHVVRAADGQRSDTAELKSYEDLEAWLDRPLIHNDDPGSESRA